MFFLNAVCNSTWWDNDEILPFVAWNLRQDILVFSGEPCEIFHCVLESKSFLEKLTVIEHTIPFFLPIREAENDFLSSNAMVGLSLLCYSACTPFLVLSSMLYVSSCMLHFQKFIDYVGALLQSYVDRREQVKLFISYFQMWFDLYWNSYALVSMWVVKAWLPLCISDTELCESRWWYHEIRQFYILIKSLIIWFYQMECLTPSWT